MNSCQLSSHNHVYKLLHFWQKSFTFNSLIVSTCVVCVRLFGGNILINLKTIMNELMCRVCLKENAHSSIHEINTFIDTEKTVLEILQLFTEIQVNIF